MIVIQFYNPFAFFRGCLEPPLSAIPEGSFKCKSCKAAAAAGITDVAELLAWNHRSLPKPAEVSHGTCCPPAAVPSHGRISQSTVCPPSLPMRCCPSPLSTLSA